jgi:hypothetical protein
MPPGFDAMVGGTKSDTMVREALHTKFASPRRLVRELEGLLGDDARFTVEVRELLATARYAD